MPSSVAPRGATGRHFQRSVTGWVGRATRISLATGRAAAPAAASAATRAQALETVLRSAMVRLRHVGVGRVMAEPGDDGEHRSHQPPRKAGGGHLTLKFEQQA